MPALLYEPRRWQSEALAAWDSAGRRGIVEVVTGAGKTVFAELCMMHVLEVLPNARVVVIVPTVSLMDQWYVSLQEELGVDEVDVSTWSGRSKPKEPSRFNILVMNTARRWARKVSSGCPAMLVVDEVHRAGSPSNSLALEGRYAATLGMSATPKREYDDAFSEVVEPALGDVVYVYDINAARSDGVVSAFDLINVAVDLCPDEQENYAKASGSIARLRRETDEDPDTDERVKMLLRRRARISALARLRVPVAARLLERHRGARSMVFHEDIGEANRLLHLLVSRGHSATIYHSRIGDVVRRDNLRLYRQGVFDVLISCRALDEGVNIPETQVAVIASATASTRQRVQRLGRVLRPAKGKDAAIVYTLYATSVEEERLSREASRLDSARSISWQKAVVHRG